MTYTSSQVATLLAFLRSPLIAAAKTGAAFAVAGLLVWLAHFGVTIPAGTKGALVSLIVACVATGWTFASNAIAKKFPAAAKVLGPAAAYRKDAHR
jgi:VIT1/CCC1 family predicted Fe2+/Mn2+ transporter